MGMQMLNRRREQTRRRHIPAIGLSLVLLCCSFLPLNAQNKTIPEGSRIFITPMDRNLDGFITAEIQKQKIPVEVRNSYSPGFRKSQQTTGSRMSRT